MQSRSSRAPTERIALHGWIADGYGFDHVETGEPLGANRSRLVSANAYIGVDTIVSALEQGADLVLAGRVTDPALALGPAMFHHGWAADDWDRLAAGVWKNWPACSGLETRRAR